eukprot:symbB.v1.2.030416.t1/scaffold3426.1/size60583/1
MQLIFQVMLLALVETPQSADVANLNSFQGGFRALDKARRRLQNSTTDAYGIGSYPTCSEQYCYGTVYTEDGEMDLDATMMQVSFTCATYDEGCPCNEEWEVQCDSYGMKTCHSKSEGCYDPFAVTCNEETEHLCKDEWSAYCWDKSWGSCPVSCTGDQTYCSSYVYDSEGNVNWTAPVEQFCANLSTGCPCDATWEDKCVDTVYNYSWCTPKTYPCPITCGMDEQVCYHVTYLSTGEPDWNAPQNSTCAPLNGSCPCDSTHEEQCNTTWGSYCQAKYGGMSCPLNCKDDEHYCYSLAYDEFGNQNYSAPWQESCADATVGCPCDATWEHKCTADYGFGGYSWCQSIFDLCPVDCGTAVTCWHYSGNQSCATDAGCTCEANELECEDSVGKNECYAKEWYEKCPLSCNYDTQNWCYRVGFDSDGMMTWEEYCHEKTGEDDWFCPVLCNSDTAKSCPWSDDYSECVPLADTCPEVCTAEEHTCWVENYDASGNYVSGSDVCAPKNEDCPCGENTHKCTFDGYAYCQSKLYSCPVVCADDEKYCYPISFTAEGEYDWTAPVQESCAKKNATCGCGSNAKLCKFTDDWGYEEEWCTFEGDSCPVTCTADQRRCYLTDYNASGYPEKYSESCVAEGKPCPCGTNTRECDDPFYGETFCYPKVDFWLKEPTKCPVVCSENQDYCYDPILSAASFADFQGEVAKQLHDGNEADAKELWLSAVEILHKPWFLAPTTKPIGLPPLRVAPCMAEPCTRCDQSRGGFQFPWLGSWTRRACMPVPGSESDAAWQRLLTRPEKMDRMLVAAYSSGKVAEDVAPMAMATVLERATDRPGYASKMGDPILSAASFADFQGEVAKQLHDGNEADAKELWLSAVEILHKPWFLAPTTKPIGLPPLRVAPCMAEPCTRCDQSRGGFQFPWLGSWTRRACMPVPGSESDAAWQRLLTRPEKMDRMLVAAYSSGKVAEDVAPMAMATVLERATDRPGYASKMGVLQAWHGFQR